MSKLLPVTVRTDGSTLYHWHFRKDEDQIETSFYKVPADAFNKLPGKAQRNEDETWKTYRATTPEGLDLEINIFLEVENGKPT